MLKMKVGLVGCGNIGADLCIGLQKGTIPAEIVALTDTDESHARRLLNSFNLNAKVCDLDENAAMADFLVECAQPSAVERVVAAAIKHHRDCLILSVGGLMDHPDIIAQARERGVEIRIPSGAISGLDGIRAAMEAGLHHVTLTTRKPPKGLSGAPYLVEKGIDVDNLTDATVVFEGSAREACRAFPHNVNVAAALSLTGIGPDETRVRVIADPRATTNSHEIVVEGAFGMFRTMTENLASPRNPKSSYLASLSAIAELRAAATQFVAHHQN
ncbi:MAG TPA: aspartate dehydrogenase [Candidatus Hydrogenedentes bacterium]|nr:aspartate dehydrogenase [Candidatus Hydrogenedentota bacterium]